MGITSSTESNPRKGVPEKLKIQLEAVVGAAENRVKRELYALFPASTDQPKEGYTEKDDEELEVRIREFMKQGNCKEPFKAWEDCLYDDTKSYKKCNQLYAMLKKCMGTHSIYYHSILELIKTSEEQMNKEVVACVYSFVEQEREEAAKKQAETKGL